MNYVRVFGSYVFVAAVAMVGGALSGYWAGVKPPAVVSPACECLCLCPWGYETMCFTNRDESGAPVGQPVPWCRSIIDGPAGAGGDARRIEKIRDVSRRTIETYD